MNKCSFVERHESREHLKSAMSYYQMLAVTLAANIGDYEIEKYSHKTYKNTAPVITFHCLAENAEVRKDFFEVLKGCVTTFFGKGIGADGFSPGDELMMKIHAADKLEALEPAEVVHAQLRNAIRVDVDEKNFSIRFSDARNEPETLPPSPLGPFPPSPVVRYRTKGGTHRTLHI